MNFPLPLFIVLLLAPLAALHAADELIVYPPVPGLSPSEHYQVLVRSARPDSKWQSAFVWETACKKLEKKSAAYFDTLAGWTHGYVNFETAGPVEIEISRVNGHPPWRRV